MDTVFNVTVTHTSVIGGCTHVQRAVVTGAKTVNLKEKIVKKILNSDLSTESHHIF